MSIEAVQRPVPVPTEFSKPFWDATKEKRLLLQFCPTAKKFQHFPRPVSLYTGQRNLQWREVSGRGSVYAVTVTHRGPPIFRGAEPYLVATIELDEGVRFISNVVNCVPSTIRVGQRVKLLWVNIGEEFRYPFFQPDAEAV